MKKTILILFTIILAMISCNKDDTSVDNITVPTLTTLAITDITSTSAKSGGDITDTGGADITAKGICWSTTQSPTILDFTTDEGNNPSNYTSYITDLTVNTTYFVRAYAINSKGTAYGNEFEFVAENIFPGEKVSVAGGTFTMGNPDGNVDEQPQHSVTLSNFSISKYEITNAQYATFMNEVGVDINGSFIGLEYIDMADTGVKIHYTNGSFIAYYGEENTPVVQVNWYGAKAYSEYYGGRLPTEAEWEFAALGGNSSNGYIYSGSDNIDDVAWYYNNSGATHIVGTKNANELGIYDMSGNVMEWTNDWYDSNYYSSSPSNDPQGPLYGTKRITRGGSFGNYNLHCRVTFRTNTKISSYTDNYLGFRPVFTP